MSTDLIPSRNTAAPSVTLDLTRTPDPPAQNGAMTQVVADVRVHILDPGVPGGTGVPVGLGLPVEAGLAPPVGRLESALTDAGPVLHLTDGQGLRFTAAGVLLDAAQAPTGSRDRAVANGWPKNLSCHQVVLITSVPVVLSVIVLKLPHVVFY